MDSIKKWFRRLFDGISRFIHVIKNLYNEDRRKFWEITLKFISVFSYFIILFIPFYSQELNGEVQTINLLDTGPWFIYFVIYLWLPIVYLSNALDFKYKTANKVFKINSILSITMFIYFILSFFSSRSDYPIVNFSLNIGFYFNLAFTIIIFILAYYDKPFLKGFYKVFRIPDIIEVEYID